MQSHSTYPYSSMFSQSALRTYARNVDARALFEDSSIDKNSFLANADHVFNDVVKYHEKKNPELIQTLTEIKDKLSKGDMVAKQLDALLLDKNIYHYLISHDDCHFLFTQLRLQDNLNREQECRYVFSKTLSGILTDEMITKLKLTESEKEICKPISYSFNLLSAKVTEELAEIQDDYNTDRLRYKATCLFLERWFQILQIAMEKNNVAMVYAVTPALSMLLHDNDRLIADLSMQARCVLEQSKHLIGLSPMRAVNHESIYGRADAIPYMGHFNAIKESARAQIAAANNGMGKDSMVKKTMSVFNKSQDQLRCMLAGMKDFTTHYRPGVLATSLLGEVPTATRSNIASRNKRYSAKTKNIKKITKNQVPAGMSSRVYAPVNSIENVALKNIIMSSARPVSAGFVRIINEYCRLQQLNIYELAVFVKRYSGIVLNEQQRRTILASCQQNNNKLARADRNELRRAMYKDGSVLLSLLAYKSSILACALMKFTGLFVSNEQVASKRRSTLFHDDIVNHSCSHRYFNPLVNMTSCI